MTILSLYRGFEVIVFSIVTIVTIYSIVNPKELIGICDIIITMKIKDQHNI